HRELVAAVRHLHCAAYSLCSDQGRERALTLSDAPPYGGNATVPAGIARLQLAVLWLVGFSGAFVRFEPAPYEFIMALAIVLFAVSGLKLRPAHVPLLVLMIA